MRTNTDDELMVTGTFAVCVSGGVSEDGKERCGSMEQVKYDHSVILNVTGRQHDGDHTENNSQT